MRLARYGAWLLTAAQLAATAAVVVRLARGRDRRPRVAAGETSPPGGVTVVIPARDEERRLGPCLTALRADPAVTEIVVVDDESRDGTAALARSLGASVVMGEPLPTGWVGKPWALHQGLMHASNPWVVTLDSDTRPATGFVAGAVAAAAEHRLDLLSVTGRYETDGPAEQALHAAMLATLLYRFGPPDSRHRPKPSRTVVNGQCLVVRSEALRAAGGFTLAARHLTDDVALARALATRGWRVGTVDGGALLTVDMHDGAFDVWREWGRSMPMADVTAATATVADLAVLGLTTTLPLLRVIAARPGRTDIALLALRWTILAALRSTYPGSRIGLLASPLADPLVLARLTYGAVRRSRRWRGRTYPGS